MLTATLLFLYATVASVPWQECVGNTLPEDDGPGARAARQACEQSPTTANGQPQCSGRLIFEDNFDGPALNPKRWRPDLQIAGYPDYEFAWFTNDAKNLFIRDGLLFLKPTLVSTANDFLTAGTIDLTKKGCTGEQPTECMERAIAFNILPPVASARVRSKERFSFRYGTVEVRAKLPDGFWLYPELYLEPAERRYGRARSGRVVLATSRGNARLKGAGGEDVGARRLEAGLQLGFDGRARDAAMRARDLPLGEAWNADFHTFRFRWTPERAVAEVDGAALDAVEAPALGLQQLLGAGAAAAEEEAGAATWAEGERMAPFDREFYLTLGLGVGGTIAFPDNSSSAGHPKPWRNKSVKSRLDFLRDKANWRDTWAWDDAALQVDYVKVWAL
ncbi:hypothetical protein R5R35_003491 [Gryllus longicercus]|uniref:GH16 domain-containing protein n=1 Tax=Gryllus longicercus TaxID=2509291 RepID=A0AAN9VWU4_9ORTH